MLKVSAVVYLPYLNQMQSRSSFELFAIYLEVCLEQECGISCNIDC